MALGISLLSRTVVEAPKVTLSCREGTGQSQEVWGLVSQMVTITSFLPETAYPVHKVSMYWVSLGRQFRLKGYQCMAWPCINRASSL